MDIKQFSQGVSPTSSNLTTKSPHIIHLVSDLKTNLVTHIKDFGIRSNSIYAIYSSIRQIKLAGKTFNGKDYYNQLKGLLRQRKINVLVENIFPKELPNNKFFIIDHSVLSQSLEHVLSLTSEKNTLKYLFSNLKESFLEVKSHYPDIPQTVIFCLNKYDTGLITVLAYLSNIPKSDISVEFNVFDDAVIISLSPSEDLFSLIPIMHYDDGNIVLIKTNLNKIETKLKSSDLAALKRDAAAKIPAKNAAITALADAKKTEVQKIGSSGLYEPNLEIDQKALSKILKTYSVKDLTISSNIKAAVDKYLAEVKPDPALINKDHLEQLILKSIHHSLYQTDDVREEFLHDPGLLFKKLVDVNNHTIPLDIAPLRTNQLINPQHIVDIKTVNCIRTPFELDEQMHDNIKSLFMSLESKKSSPIKVLGITSNYEDDNLNRYLKYEIKVQNVTGGSKEPYLLSLKIPALTNERYLKLNGSSYILLSQQYLVKHSDFK